MAKNGITSGGSTADAPSSAATGRLRKLTDKLYQCLVADQSCSCKVSFGERSFCSWLLRDEAGRSEHNIPCCTDKKSDHVD